MKEYINRFFSLKTAIELMPFFQLSSNSAGKEVTESMGCWRAAIESLKLDPKRKDLDCVVVGDGCTPRTAAMVCHLSKWNCISVDPQLDKDRYNKVYKERLAAGMPIQRLSVYRSTIEDLPDNLLGKSKEAVLMLPHSHAKMDMCLKKLKECYDKFHVISMPCCEPTPEKYTNKRFAERTNLKVYTDPNVWSPKRTMYVWTNLTKELEL